MKQESHIRLSVFDFGDDPSIVTETLGIEPTKSWAKGDSNNNKPNSFRHNSRWELQSPLPLSVEPGKHIDKLLSILESNAEIVRKAKQNFDATILCAIYYYDTYNEGFNLSESIIQRLSKLELSIDFDLYFLGNEDCDN
jgi:hypothetical protein